jgi:shikimate dehydrogenase
MPPIDGHTRLVAHIGHPTRTFKSPMIYNPYFASANINAVVVPMDCTADHFASVLKAVFSLGNTIGALITMPHKMSVVSLLDEVGTDMLFEQIPAYLEYFGLPSTSADRLRQVARVSY